MKDVKWHVDKDAAEKRGIWLANESLRMETFHFYFADSCLNNVESSIQFFLLMWTIVNFIFMSLLPLAAKQKESKELGEYSIVTGVTVFAVL